MKYYKRAKMFRASNATFYPFEMKGYSYRWFQLVACLNGRVYFNNHHYSMPTRYHQDAIKNTLNHLGVKFTTVWVSNGLQDIKTAILRHNDTIKELQVLIDSPRTRKSTNKNRAQQIKHLQKEVKYLEKLNKMKETPYKGKLNFNNLPKPEPMSEYQLERRRDSIARRKGYESYEKYLKTKHNNQFSMKFNKDVLEIDIEKKTA